MKQAILTALTHYQAGRPAEALAALEDIPAPDRLLDHEVFEATRLERKAADGTAVSAAVLDWVELARDRIRHDLGQPAPPAVVSVGLALTTAARLLGGDL